MVNRRVSARVALAFLAVLAPLLAAPATTAAASPADRVIDCRGPFARDSGHARLVAWFGRRHVRHQKVHGAEGEKLSASVVDPSDPKGRLEFIWNDVKLRRHPWMRIENESTWRVQDGIRVGMTLAELERINGGPFGISGFGWDYGGHVTDWRGGVLSRPLPGGCSVGIDLYPAADAPQASLNNVTGEETFASDNPDMRATRPVVGVLIVYYTKP